MRAEALTKPMPIVTSVVDFAGPSKTRGPELIPMSENPALKLPYSDCFAALRAAGAGVQQQDLHRVDSHRAAWQRGSCHGHRRVGGPGRCNVSAAQMVAADGLQWQLPLWIALERLADSDQPWQ